ncbi:MAG: hypothetical protein VZR73_11145, partial [Acutalibacteraceae bacterium]|nr:hypothetical protein [Acutalibacteraceae bacterium]
MRQGGSQSRDPASAAAEVESLHSDQSLDASSGVSRFCFRGGVWFFCHLVFCDNGVTIPVLCLSHNMRKQKRNGEKRKMKTRKMFKEIAL